MTITLLLSSKPLAFCLSSISTKKCSTIRTAGNHYCSAAITRNNNNKALTRILRITSTKTTPLTEKLSNGRILTRPTTRITNNNASPFSTTTSVNNSSVKIQNQQRNQPQQHHKQKQIPISNENKIYRKVEMNWESVMLEYSKILNEIKMINTNNDVGNNNNNIGSIALRARYLLINVVNLPSNSNSYYEKGPLSSRLLEAIDRNITSSGIVPNEVMAKLYTLTIESWLDNIKNNRRREHARYEVERLLWDMTQNKNNIFFTQNNIKKNVETINNAFSMVIYSFIKEGMDNKNNQGLVSNKTKRRIDNIIYEMEKLWDNPSIPLVRCRSSINSILYYMYKLQKPDIAYNILKRMIYSYEIEKNAYLKPSATSFSTVISAYAKAGNPDKAKDIIEWMLSSGNRNHDGEDNNNGHNSYYYPPNTFCFNSLLDAWAKSGHEHAGVRAEEVLNWMIELQENNNHNCNDNNNTQIDVQPDAFSYTTVINAWSKTKGIDDAPERAESILKRMLELQKSGKNIIPNEITFGSVVNAWAHSNHPNAVDRAFAIMALMEKLNVDDNNNEHSPNSTKLTGLYNILITALSKSKNNEDVGKKALEILEHMKSKGIAPDIQTHTAIISALSQQSATDGISSGDENNGDSNKEGPWKAVAYFLNLEEQFSANLDKPMNDTKNDNESITTEQSSSRGTIEEEFVVQLNTFAFNVALNALALTKSEDSPKIAMELLNKMFQYAYNDGIENIEPDTATYNIVMKIISKSSALDPNDAIQRVEELLNDMENNNNKSTARNIVRPSAFTYSTCISTWGQTQHPERFEQMKLLLFRMEHSYTNGNLSDKPTVIPYNALFVACCRTSVHERARALRCVLETLDHMRRLYLTEQEQPQKHSQEQQKKENDNYDGGENARTSSHTMIRIVPNYYTYRVILRAIRCNVEPGNRLDSLVEREFNNCCNDGLLSNEVIDELKKASPKVFMKYVGSNSIGAEQQ